MDTSTLSVPERRAANSGRGGFSLVEVTLAIGIVSFAFVTLFGLLPVGLNTSRQSVNTSIGTQILQRVTTDLQQSDFDALITDGSGAAITSASGVKAVRYFDEQGDELPISQVSRAVYLVNTRVTPTTFLPSTAAATPAMATLATVTVQVAASASATQLRLGTDNLWASNADGSAVNARGLPVMTEAMFVSRKSSRTAP